MKISAWKLLLLMVVTNVFVSSGKEKKTVFDTLSTNKAGNGIEMTIIMEKGKFHNHPTFAFWIEDLEGNYIQPLMVTKYVATGIFGYSPVNDSLWTHKEGEAYRPATLPYWNHKRISQPEFEKIVPGHDNSIPDSYTSATPAGNFYLHTKSNEILKGKFRLILEINQTWDWNEYWTNNKFPEDKHYRTSCQPSLVYAVTIDPTSETKEYWLNPIGHGHYAGRDGNLYTDLSTLTTAKEIVKSIKVIMK